MTQRELPPPRVPDPMDAPALRWGILAPGWIAQQFATALRQGTRQEIVAVGSRNVARARAFADEHGAPAAYGSYDELVHDPQIDIVYVASPHSEHHRLARLALEAGKPVLVEKAFTRNAAEARDLVDFAQAKGLFLLEGMWSRFLPHYDVVHQALQNGLIGEVTTVFADHGQHLYPDGPDRLSSPDLAGGALLDLGVYPISFADFVLGPFTSITATGTLTDRGVDQQESHHSGQRRRRARRPARLHARRLALHRLDLRHQRADWTSTGTFYLPTSVQLYDRDGVLIDRHDPSGDVAHQGLRYEAAEAARCLSAGATESPLHPPATTVRIMAAMDEVRRQLGVRFSDE